MVTSPCSEVRRQYVGAHIDNDKYITFEYFPFPDIYVVTLGYILHIIS